LTLKNSAGRGNEEERDGPGAKAKTGKRMVNKSGLKKIEPWKGGSRAGG